MRLSDSVKNQNAGGNLQSLLFITRLHGILYAGRDLQSRPFVIRENLPGNGFKILWLKNC